MNWAKGAIAAGLTMPEVLRALAVKARDNARTPMQWDASPHAGFTTGTPWLPVNPNHTEINAEAARKDPDSVFHHYRRLIALRHVLPVVVHGELPAPAARRRAGVRLRARARRHDAHGPGQRLGRARRRAWPSSVWW